MSTSSIQASAILCEIRREVPALHEAAEGMARVLRENLHGLCSTQDAFAAELLLREALTNAVVHGCGMSQERTASVAIRVRTDRVTIAIDDRGPGFDWRSMIASVADNYDESGRGAEIYRTFASLVRFNGKGNKVILVRRFSHGNRNI
jgi:serine/threonine-protein kinase RsbW